MRFLPLELNFDKMAGKTRFCRVNAPCKINLHLEVKGLRPDGYHEIESLFAPLDFGDSLEFSLIDPPGKLEFQVKTEGENSCFGDISALQSEKNIVCKAVRFFRDETGFEDGIRVVLIKRVPVGAGLGGGSSDAASTLRALDLLAKTRLSDEALLDMALMLGSDVPFFLKGGPAWVSGRGEIFEKAVLPGGLGVILVMPDFSISTAEAFTELDRYRQKKINNDLWGNDQKHGMDFRKINLSEIETWPFFNDFFPVLPQKEYINYIQEMLKKCGAFFAGVSGSGPCYFGIFNRYINSDKIQQYLQYSKFQYSFVKSSFFLASLQDPVLELS